MRVALVSPEIPQNTGNIARTCAATGAQLHLIEPLGFSLDDRYLKRAGLDYWPMAQVIRHPCWEAFAAAYPGARMHFATTKAPRDYAGVRYGPDDFLVFGRETKGLPEELLSARYDQCVRIPMREGARSLNLANSVAVVLYEALRQQGFAGLVGRGHLNQTPEGPEWRDYV
jgi:tRNA (cytidine/uridine-2'-O-)-methyltransferase